MRSNNAISSRSVAIIAIVVLNLTLFTVLSPRIPRQRDVSLPNGLNREKLQAASASRRIPKDGPVSGEGWNAHEDRKHEPVGTAGNQEHNQEHSGDMRPVNEDAVSESGPASDHAPMPTSNEAHDAVESEINRVVEAWRECTLIGFLHISKTGGTAFNACADRLSSLGLKFHHSAGGLQPRGAMKAVMFLRTLTLPWLRCIDRAKQNPEVNCDDEGQPWDVEKVLFSMESSHRQFLEELDSSPLSRDLDSKTCYFSILREPSQWMTSAYNHAVRMVTEPKRAKKNLKAENWHMLHHTTNFQTAYFEELENAPSLTLFSTDKMGVLYETFRRLVGLSIQNAPPPCIGDVGANTHKDTARYRHDIDWSEWAQAYNELDGRLYELVRERGICHLPLRAAREGEIETKAMREFFDIMESFESHTPPDGEAILKYIESHRVAFDGDNSTNA